MTNKTLAERAKTAAETLFGVESEYYMVQNTEVAQIITEQDALIRLLYSAFSDPVVHVAGLSYSTKTYKALQAAQAAGYGKGE